MIEELLEEEEEEEEEEKQVATTAAVRCIIPTLCAMSTYVLPYKN